MILIQTKFQLCRLMNVRMWQQLIVFTAWIRMVVQGRVCKGRFSRRQYMDFYTALNLWHCRITSTMSLRMKKINKSPELSARLAVITMTHQILHRTSFLLKSSPYTKKSVNCVLRILWLSAKAILQVLNIIVRQLLMHFLYGL